MIWVLVTFKDGTHQYKMVESLDEITDYFHIKHITKINILENMSL